MCPAHAAAGSLRWLVTVDAMHTQVVTAKLICATLKSHYLMIVKSNQAKILAVSPRCPGPRCPQPLPTTPAATAVSRPAPCNHHRCTRNRLPLRKTNHPDHS
ncbi:putative transposase for IS2404 [Mycobacterium ulcerans str. Harvey]|uniref:Transposase for IS2404 n=1 Tax=Mycobacterium ulcerans str. Harvey TaxID=1299332 RepID=A0ABN0QWD1_MYCUL|nr:putative transposase for IS2404 [Mycobacterium ulcerans str. Harvey]